MRLLVAFTLLAVIALFNVNLAASQAGTDLNGRALVETLRKHGETRFTLYSPGSE